MRNPREPPATASPSPHLAATPAAWWPGGAALPAGLAGAATTVEARHAGWIGALIGTPSAPPAPNAVDKPETKAQILAAVKGTGFITGYSE